MSREAQRAARRAELLDAADRVIIRKGPEASMTAIAAEAGITKPILYRHFGDKGGLYRALAERYVGPIVGAIRTALTEPGASRRARALGAVDAYLVFIEDNPMIYRFLMHRALADHPEAHSAVSAFVRRIGDEIGAVLRDDFELTTSQERAAEAWGHALVGMVQVSADWWLATKPTPREEFVDHLVALLWDGLGDLATANGD